jgi:TolB protein
VKRNAPWFVTIAIALAAGGPAHADPVLRNTFPAPSPDGLHVAFVSNRDSADAMWVIDTDGAHERRVSPAGVAAEAPTWSADGSTVRYFGAGVDSGSAYGVPLAGGTARRLARVPGRSPRLSPDGKRALYLVGPWASAELRVAEVAGGSTTHVAGGSASAWNGAWSPDSKRIAYTFGDSTRVL